MIWLAGRTDPSLRSELALERSEGMTCRTPLEAAHGKSSLQMSTSVAKNLSQQESWHKIGEEQCFPSRAEEDKKRRRSREYEHISRLPMGVSSRRGVRG